MSDGNYLGSDTRRDLRHGDGAHVESGRREDPVEFLFGCRARADEVVANQTLCSSVPVGSTDFSGSFESFSSRLGERRS